MQAKIRLKLIAKEWNDESEEVRNKFKAAASVAKKIHAKKYEGYQFKRRPPKNRQKLSVLEKDTILDSSSTLMSDPNNSPSNNSPCLQQYMSNDTMESYDNNNIQQFYYPYIPTDLIIILCSNKMG